MSPEKRIELLDVSAFSYEERVCAAALQGLINRGGACVFLDYGIYDDPAARRTNELFMDDEHWYGKFRDLLGNQDQNNLEYYRKEHGFEVTHVKDLSELLGRHKDKIKGYLVWDDTQPDTINLAAMLAGLEDLVPVSPQMEDWARNSGLRKVDDLRGRWHERVEIYTWALEHLFPRCKQSFAACLEPGWQRPEFLDYAVQHRLFVYSLGSTVKGFGSTLLLLLAFGPPWLRELLFALRLDGPLKRLALSWMAARSPEVKLGNRIQRAVEARPYPTLFGWHTQRDDELSFMFQLSANGLRLVPCHLAGNFSFHSRVQPLGEFKPDALPDVKLDPHGTYVTFTLSDGDQLMMSNTAQLGSWRSPARGGAPFNWECQPLLVDLAPALFERFTRTKTDQDCLIAGPSGAGYIVPPLARDFKAYMQSTAEVCCRAGVRTVTTYVADPPRRVLRQLEAHKGDLLGFMSGYAVVSRAPQQLVNDTPIIANQIPLVAHIWDEPAQIFERLEELLRSPEQTPRFIGLHLFAYRTTFDEVAEFINKHAGEHLHFVKADEFLAAAKQHLATKRK